MPKKYRSGKKAENSSLSKEPPYAETHLDITEQLRQLIRDELRISTLQNTTIGLAILVITILAAILLAK